MITLGIDEVGRGCWAGPLVACAVILKDPIVGLKDSKLLSKSQRERLNIIIKDSAISIGIGWVQPAELDEVGMTIGTSLAMQRALDQLDADYDEIIIDGHINFLSNNPKSRPIIKADSIIPSVSAASIVAKQARDQYMADIAKDYPDYGFEKHVGYGTALHLEKLKKYGVSDIHRLSFKPLKTLLASQNSA